MPLIGRVFAGGSAILVCVVLMGLVARKRTGSCWTFVLYLVAVGVADALIALWPERFWRRDFWMLKEGIHNILKLGIVLELMIRIFSPFPSAYAVARRGVILIVAGIVVLISFSVSSGTDYRAVVGRLNPHVNDGTVWLFVALAAVCLWYHLPLDILHKAILIGLVPYLLVYSVVQRMIAALGWERGDFLNRTAPVAYLALLAYWASVASRSGPDLDSGTRVGRLISGRKP
jgi:hypothetical protein